MFSNYSWTGRKKTIVCTFIAVNMHNISIKITGCTLMEKVSHTSATSVQGLSGKVFCQFIPAVLNINIFPRKVRTLLKRK